MTDCIKHLIECQCILTIFKNKSKPIYHKIPVFSIVNNDNELQEKYVICDNCDIVHFVTDFCKSEIKWGVEGLKSLVSSKEDIKFNLLSLDHERLVDILEINNMHVSDWEYAEYLISNNKEGTIVLQKSETDNNIVYNVLHITDNNIRIKKEITQRYL